MNLDDKELARLIHLASQAEDGDFRPPSEDAVDAYLAGSATPEQVAEVQDAIIANRRFRQELVEQAGLAFDVDDVPALQPAYDREPNPSRSELKRFVQGAGENEGTTARPWWSRIADIFLPPAREAKGRSSWAPRVALAGMATALVVVVGAVILLDLFPPDQPITLLSAGEVSRSELSVRTIQLDAPSRGDNGGVESLAVPSDETIVITMRFSVPDYDATYYLHLVDPTGVTLWRHQLSSEERVQSVLHLRVPTDQLSFGVYELQLRDEYNAPIYQYPLEKR